VAEDNKILVQCDFDGTITEGDVSFAILDAYARPDWRQLFQDYEDGKITVGQFNTEAFSTVKADKNTLLEIVRKETRVRPGLKELVTACRRKGYRFVIVSNGLRFYIDDILQSLGLTGIEVFAAETDFRPEGLDVRYTGPDGKYLDTDFKIAYLNFFHGQGYRLTYIGNGSSDLAPARISERIFAIDTLLKRCNEERVSCIPFTDLSQIALEIESF
jgi:2-hydroxy-3-keto-5-methylthiopentenyl-1-phosphate phosphatase